MNYKDKEFLEDDDDLLLDSDISDPSEDSDTHIIESAASAADNHDFSDSSDSLDVSESSEPSESQDLDDFYNDNDYEDEPEEAPRQKHPKLDPEDPDYWLDEQSEFEHIMPKRRNVWKWWFAAAVIFVAAIVGLWVWFFHPYVDDAVKYGYIKSMERRGTIVKTFEGILIPYRELGDETPTYFEEISFSVDSDSLAAHMKAMMLDCVPVRLGYEQYHHSLFWKGASPMIIVSADTADINHILPPEYR